KADPLTQIERLAEKKMLQIHRTRSHEIPTYHSKISAKKKINHNKIKPHQTILKQIKKKVEKKKIE
ncbi:hypothetical protein ACQWFV_24625, partial [Salmonella enterica subsp. enterica serovar Infantis]